MTEPAGGERKAFEPAIPCHTGSAESERAMLEPAVRASRLIHGALMATVLVYVLLSVILSGIAAPGVDGEADRPDPTLTVVLGAVALMQFGLATALPGMLLQPERLAPLGGDPARVAAHYRSACVVRAALLETPAVIGLVMAMLGSPPWIAWTLLGLTFVAFGLTVPSVEFAEALLRRSREA